MNAECPRRFSNGIRAELLSPSGERLGEGGNFTFDLHLAVSSANGTEGKVSETDVCGRLAPKLKPAR